MIEVKCIDKQRNKSGAITAYKLADRAGEVKILKPAELKDLIRKGSVKVVNLTLTSDGRLVEKQIKPAETGQSKKANMAYWDEIDDTTEEFVREFCSFATTEIDLDDDEILEISKSVIDCVIAKFKEFNVDTDKAFPYVDENY